jgi:hypothetical protein
MKKEEERVKFRVIVVNKFPYSFEVKRRVQNGEEEVNEVKKK